MTWIKYMDEKPEKCIPDGWDDDEKLLPKYPCKMKFRHVYEFEGTFDPSKGFDADFKKVTPCGVFCWKEIKDEFKSM